MNRAILAMLLAGTLFTMTSARSQEVDPAPDTAEPGSIEAIAGFTSEPRFLNPWVAYVPASASVPSPSSVLGHVIGAAGELTHSAAIVDYVRRVG